MGKLYKATGKWRIVPKRDFGSGPGFFIDGRYVKTGFIAVNGCTMDDGFKVGRCNMMPGATWFETVEEATLGIKVYDECAAHGLDSDEWWKRIYAINAAKSDRKVLHATK